MFYDFILERPALFALLGLGLVVYYVVEQRRLARYGKPLPMPRGLPILGNIFQLGRMPWYQMTRWSKELGALNIFWHR